MHIKLVNFMLVLHCQLWSVGKSEIIVREGADYTDGADPALQYYSQIFILHCL